MAQDYRKLKVWEKAMDLADQVYNITEPYPKSEIYGLASQMRRSAVSIPSNIAEGNGRSGDQEFYRFISIAKGSLAELETQIMLSFRRKFINKEDFEKLMSLSDEVGRMLYSLQKTIKAAA